MTSAVDSVVLCDSVHAQTVSVFLCVFLSGMMLGGGCGRELAHWIIHGRPEKDMYGYDIRYVNAQ